jgi:hypothetical protein
LPKECQWSGDIRKVLDRWTDWHTDILFASSRDEVMTFVYPLSRMYCDIERLVDDPMEDKGQGITYRSIDGCIRELNKASLDEIYQSYWDARQMFYDIAKEQDTLIIDCH